MITFVDDFFLDFARYLTLLHDIVVCLIDTWFALGINLLYHRFIELLIKVIGPFKQNVSAVARLQVSIIFLFIESKFTWKSLSFAALINN